MSEKSSLMLGPGSRFPLPRTNVALPIGPQWWWWISRVESTCHARSRKDKIWCIFWETKRLSYAKPERNIGVVRSLFHIPTPNLIHVLETETKKIEEKFGILSNVSAVSREGSTSATDGQLNFLFQWLFYAFGRSFQYNLGKMENNIKTIGAILQDWGKGIKNRVIIISPRLKT